MMVFVCRFGPIKNAACGAGPMLTIHPINVDREECSFHSTPTDARRYNTLDMLTLASVLSLRRL
jgi:hypothetical protein